MTWPWVVAFCLLVAFCVGLCFLVLGVASRAIAALERSNQLAPIAQPDPFGWPAGTTLRDSPLLAPVSADGAVFLVLSAGCLPCRSLSTGLATEGLGQIGRHLVVLVDSMSEWIQPLVDMGFDVRNHGGQAAELFGTSTTPIAFRVTADRIIDGSLIPGKPSDLRRLIAPRRSPSDISPTDRDTQFAI